LRERDRFYFSVGLDITVFIVVFRAVARSENLGGHVILGGGNVPPWLR